MDPEKDATWEIPMHGLLLLWIKERGRPKQTWGEIVNKDMSVCRVSLVILCLIEHNGQVGFMLPTEFNWVLC